MASTIQHSLDNSIKFCLKNRIPDIPLPSYLYGDKLVDSYYNVRNHWTLSSSASCNFAEFLREKSLIDKEYVTRLLKLCSDYKPDNLISFIDKLFFPQQTIVFNEQLNELNIQNAWKTYVDNVFCEANNLQNQADELLNNVLPMYRTLSTTNNDSCDAECRDVAWYRKLTTDAYNCMKQARYEMFSSQNDLYGVMPHLKGNFIDDISLTNLHKLDSTISRYYYRYQACNDEYRKAFHEAELVRAELYQHLKTVSLPKTQNCFTCQYSEMAALLYKLNENYFEKNEMLTVGMAPIKQHADRLLLNGNEVDLQIICNSTFVRDAISGWITEEWEDWNGIYEPYENYNPQTNLVIQSQ